MLQSSYNWDYIQTVYQSKTRRLGIICLSLFPSACGVEDHHREIRLKVFVWMVKNKDAVVQIRKKYIHFTFDSVFSLTKQKGTPQTWMGAAHIACSAMALNIHINTFYPYVNGLEDTSA